MIFVNKPLFPDYNLKDFTTQIELFKRGWEDLAKLLLWSFVAGFNEIYVPQIMPKTAAIEDEAGQGGQSG
jgi:hypothetical protein